MTVCGNCGASNADGVRFCASCGVSLVPACAHCGAELPVDARFCPSCGTPVRAAEPPPTGQERKLVTVVFADIVGSTALAEQRDPERIQEILGTFFAGMREEIEAEGGTVEKFIGDAVVAIFGVPTAHEDDPSRALRAALRMRRRLAEVNRDLASRFGVTLAVRTGVNTGDVLAATNPRPGEPMVTGDAVNVAARLEQAADPGQILVAERTARAARGFRFREVAPHELRGREEPVSAVALEGETPQEPVRGVSGLHAPMVGRDRELLLLRTLFERSVAEGRPNLVTIYGDAGVGKSRLTSEFLSWVAAQAPAPTVVRGRCLPYGDGVTYWPLAEILKGLAGVRDTDSAETTLARIRTLGAELLAPETATHPGKVAAMHPGKVAAALAFTVGVDDPEHPFRDAEPREVRTKMHVAWRLLFSALAERAPVVAVIDDIQWADAALLDLLEELAERTVGPVLLICPARPELVEHRPGWGGGKRNVSSIALQPLSEVDADRLVGALLAVEELPPSVHRRILERAEGNPFFLEEILRHLIDEGRIVRSGDRWRVAADIDSVEIPDTVQAVLASRIDLLEPIEKRTLQRAAVVGRVFWPGPVSRLLNGDGQHLRDILGRLEERELVTSRLSSSISGEPEFVFKHALTREVAYESLPRRERVQAHSAVADWIEESAGERSSEFVELLAYHHLAAYRMSLEDPGLAGEPVSPLRERAFGSLLAASEQARRRFAAAKALKLAEQACSIAGDPVRRAAALEQIGTVAISDYRGDLAWGSLTEAVELRLEHAPEDPRAIARVCARAVESPCRWPGSMHETPTEEQVQRYVDLGFESVDQEADGEELVRLLTARAFGPFSIGAGRDLRPGEYEAAREAGMRAAEMAERMGRLDLTSAALDGASSAAIVLGRYGTGVEAVERRIRLADELEDPWEAGDIFAVGAWTKAYVGRYRQAVALAEEGIRRTAGEAEGMQLHNLSWGAFGLFWLGEWDRIATELFPQIRALLGDRAEQPPYFTSHGFGTAAFVLDARGDPEVEALVPTLREMIQIEHGRSIVSGWLAWIVARRGEVADALDRLRELDRLPSRVSRPFTDQVWASVLTDAVASGEEMLDEVSPFLERARSLIEGTGLVALPVALDRLEAVVDAFVRHAPEGVEGLRRARDGFARLEAGWEVARTDLLLAEALVRAGGKRDEARSLFTAAMQVLEPLGMLREITRARKLLAALT